jgi:hypothetical protein
MGQEIDDNELAILRVFQIRKEREEEFRRKKER